MTGRLRIEPRCGRWHVVKHMAAGATAGAWVSLGGCPEQQVAVRLWLSLIGKDRDR